MEEEFEFPDYSNIPLKNDHVSRPILITPDNKVILETSSSKYRLAYEFVIAIAEPISRSVSTHEYELTQYSLYAAMVVQLTPDIIKELLHKLCKNENIPPEVISFINKNTKKYGSAKLFLRKNLYFLQIFDKTVLNEIYIKNPIIRSKLVLVSNPTALLENNDNQSKEVASHDIDKLMKESNEDKLIEELERLGNNDIITGKNPNRYNSSYTCQKENFDFL